MLQICDRDKSELRLLQKCLLCEDVHHELKCLVWVKLRNLWLEFVLIKHLKVKDVIDETD